VAVVVAAWDVVQLLHQFQYLRHRQLRCLRCQQRQRRRPLRQLLRLRMLQRRCLHLP